MSFKLVPVSKKKKSQTNKDKDIRHIKSWSNKVLMQRYEEATKFTTEREKEIEGIGLLNSSGHEEDIKKFKDALRLVEIIEDEGREREMLYFLTDEEQVEMIKDIFGSEPEDMTESEIKMHEQARRKGAVAYKVEAGKVVVLA